MPDNFGTDSSAARSQPPPLSTKPLAVQRAARVARSWRRGRQFRGAATFPELSPRHSQPGVPDEPPVFVISAGWRSGSTAVQRLIVSGGRTFVWGEPFATSRILPRLTRMMLEAPLSDDNPTRTLDPSLIGKQLADNWIATTNPSSSAVVDGARAMMEAVYWRPVAGSSFTSWGTKEVVATPDQMRALRVMFPDARIVGIVRNPVSAYRSFRRFVVSGVGTRGGPSARLSEVRGPVAYARLWKRMAATLREMAEDDQTLLVKYEDIRGEERFPDRLGEFLNSPLDSAAWSTVVGATAGENPGPAERTEIGVVRRITRREAARWDYDL